MEMVSLYRGFDNPRLKDIDLDLNIGLEYQLLFRQLGADKMPNLSSPDQYTILLSNDILSSPVSFVSKTDSREIRHIDLSRAIPEEAEALETVHRIIRLCFNEGAVSLPASVEESMPTPSSTPAITPSSQFKATFTPTTQTDMISGETQTTPMVSDGGDEGAQTHEPITTPPSRESAAPYTDSLTREMFELIKQQSKEKQETIQKLLELSEQKTTELGESRYTNEQLQLRCADLARVATEQDALITGQATFTREQSSLITDLLAQLQGNREIINEQRLELNNLNNRISELQNQYESEKSDLTRQLEASQLELLTTCDSNVKLTEEIKKLTARLERKETELTQLNRTHYKKEKHLQLRIEQLTKEQETKNKEIPTLRSQIAILEGQLNNINETLGSERESFAGRLRDRDERIDAIETILAEKIGFINEQKRVIKELEEALYNIIREFEVTQAELSTANREKDLTTTENLALKQKLEELEKQHKESIDRITARLSEMQTNSNALVLELDKLKAEKLQILTNFDQVSREYVALQEAHGALEDKHRKLIDQANRYKECRNIFFEDNKKLTAELAQQKIDHQEKVNSLTSLAEELKSKIEELEENSQLLHNNLEEFQDLNSAITDLLIESEQEEKEGLLARLQASEAEIIRLKELNEAAEEALETSAGENLALLTRLEGERERLNNLLEKAGKSNMLLQTELSSIRMGYSSELLKNVESQKEITKLNQLKEAAEEALETSGRKNLELSSRIAVLKSAQDARIREEVAAARLGTPQANIPIISTVPAPLTRQWPFGRASSQTPPAEMPQSQSPGIFTASNFNAFLGPWGSGSGATE